jgi:23S rRNA (guanosine2251-2'-O)-methyltransferase
MSDSLWVAGMIAVESVLQAESREMRAIYTALDRFDSRLAQLRRLARERGVPLEARTEAEVRALAESGSHGGIVAEVGPRRMQPLDALAVGEAPVVVMLDGVEDPFNFGQAVRSLYAAGIDGLVVRPRNWLSAGTAIRASAGATEFLATAEAESPEAAAEALRGRGWRVAVAAEDGQPMGAVDLTGPLLLVIGGEKRGVTRSFQRAADLRVRIPYGRPFAHALGTTGAATALAFEVMRQRSSRSVGQ